jgi:hypothetical protein
MNDRTDFDRLAQSWLQDGPTELPDRSLQAALDEVHVTSQWRFGAARRTFTMNGNTPRLAVAAVIGLLVLVGGGIYLSNNSSGGLGGQPVATSSPAPTPTPILTPAQASRGPGPASLAPFGQIGPPPASITVMVPAGWTSDGPTVGKAGMAVEPLLVAWQISNRFNHPCTDHTLLSPAPGPGVEELIDALASQPGITAGPITDVVVDGYRGKSVDLTVATDISTCPPAVGEDPASGFWLWASPDGDRRYVQASDEMDRIYAVDVDGTRLTFAARIPAGTTAADLADLEAIFDSMLIEPAAALSPTSP